MNNARRLTLIRKTNRRPIPALRDDSAAGIALDMATIRAIASVLMDEMERRDSQRRGLLPRSNDRPILDDLLPSLFA
jgi:hypothetical protein